MTLEDVSYIADIVGAAATFAAVVVALWTARFPYRPRIKLKFNSCALIGSGSGLLGQAISVTVTNVCNRPVTIHSWYINLKSSKRTFFVASSYSSRFNKPLPYQVDVDCNLNLFYDQDSFMQLMLEELRDGNVSRDEKLEFAVKYGPGKVKSVKSDKKLGALLDSIASNLAKPSRDIRENPTTQALSSIGQM